MEETPNLVMRCPKCGKDFPFDVLYCESCSAMLEPFVVSAEGTTGEGKADMRQGDQPDENAEDIKIDHLKADVEERFVRTLLLEKKQLARRLDEKERVLEKVRGKDTIASPELGAAEREVDEALGRLARIEQTIEEMKATVESEGASLKERVGSMPSPGPFWFLTAGGRSRKTVYGDLRTKMVLLDILEGRRPPDYRSARSALKVVAFGFALVLAVFLSWQIFDLARRVPERAGTQGKGTAVSQDKKAVSREDIVGLLDDIRKANLTKDLALWESRYSRQYLEMPGKRESVTEQWKDVDYRALAYVLEDLSIGPGKASAVVTWRIELLPKAGGEVKKLTQRLRAEFVTEDGAVKIAAVTKL